MGRQGRATATTSGSIRGKTQIFVPFRPEIADGIYQSGQRDQFEYQQLSDPTSIRLLYIEPGNRTEVIRCSLRTANLNKEPKYVALSYSWQEERWSAVNAIVGLGNAEGSIEIGQPMDDTDSNIPDSTETKQYGEGSSKMIICDGRIKHISPSLYGALLQLRGDRPGREYWIDAVCINQADNEEKTSQVKMMGRIYSAAELVVVWLGSFLAFSRPSSAQTTSVLDITYNALTLEINAGEGNDTQWWFTDLFYLTHLVSRRYFTRIWVLQEIALARAVTFFLGRHRFGPEHLSRVVNVIEEQLSATKYTLNLKLVALFLNSVSPRKMYQIKSMPFPRTSDGSYLQAGGSSLQEWLRSCVGRKAQDDRDLAFAGLSLIRPDLLRIRWDLLLEDPDSVAGRLPPPPKQTGRPVPQGQDGEIQLWNELHVDYNAPTLDVLVNLAACVLSGPDPMNLLSVSAQIRHPNEWKPKGIPSWIPTMVTNPLDMRVTLDGLRGMFSAATQLQNDPKISPDGRALVVDAHRLGKVCQSFLPIAFPHLKEEEEGMSLLKAIRELQKLPCNYRDTNISTLLVFAHANMRVEWTSADTRSQQIFKGFCGLLRFKVQDVLEKREEELRQRRWQAKMFRLTSALIRPTKEVRESWWKETERLAEEFETLKRDLQPAYAALRKSYPAAPWREDTGTSSTEQESSTKQKDKPSLPYNYARFFVHNLPDRVFLTDSRYIGQTPTRLCNGDEVMLIKGARVPYIFRRVDDALRTRIQTKEEEKETALSDSELGIVERLSHEIQSLESEIGKRDGWVLMGEAYVEGIMDGEAVAQCADHFERIRIF